MKLSRSFDQCRPQHEKLMAATSNGSRKLKLRANASFSTYKQDDQASAYAEHSSTFFLLKKCTGRRRVGLDNVGSAPELVCPVGDSRTVSSSTRGSSLAPR